MSALNNRSLQMLAARRDQLSELLPRMVKVRSSMAALGDAVRDELKPNTKDKDVQFISATARAAAMTRWTRALNEVKEVCDLIDPDNPIDFASAPPIKKVPGDDVFGGDDSKKATYRETHSRNVNIIAQVDAHIAAAETEFAWLKKVVPQT